MINEELLQIIIRKHLPPSFMGYGQNGFMCQVHYPELLKIIKDYEAQQQVKVEPEVKVNFADFKMAISLLRDLADLQNGSPLVTCEKEWQRTMDNIYVFLNEHESKISA